MAFRRKSRSQFNILLLIGTAITNDSLLGFTADAALSTQTCSEALRAADSDGDYQLNQDEYANGWRRIWKHNHRSDVFDETSDEEEIPENADLVFGLLRGEGDSIDIGGFVLPLELICQAIDDSITGSNAAFNVGEASHEFCFVTMSMTDSTYNSDGLMNSAEYLHFVNIMSLDELSCAQTFDDLPQQMQDHFDDNSSSGMVSIAGAKPSDLVSDEQRQTLISFCSGVSSLISDSIDIGFCTAPTGSPSASTETFQPTTLKTPSTLVCFYSLAKADQDRDSSLSRQEYSVFVNELSGVDNLFDGLSFNDLPSVLRSTFSDLAENETVILIPGADSGSTPTSDELETITRVCANTNAAIQSALSPLLTTPSLTPTESPSTVTSTPSTFPTTSEPSVDEAISPSTITPSEGEKTNPPSSENWTTEPTSNPTVISAEPTEQAEMASFAPSEAPSDPSDEPTFLPSATSLFPSQVASVEPTRAPTTLKSLNPSQSGGEFEISNTFLISNTVGITSLALLSSHVERSRLNVSYNNLTKASSEEVFGINGMRRLRRRLVVDFVELSGQTNTFTDIECPVTAPENTLCQTVEASFKVQVTSDENLVTVLADAQNAVETGIRGGRLQTYLDEMDSDIIIEVPFNSAQPSSAPVVAWTTAPMSLSPTQHSENETSVPSQNPGNTTVFNISAAFVILNRVGMSAAGFTEGTDDYSDINSAFGIMSTNLVSTMDIAVRYVAFSSTIVDVYDMTCPETTVGGFCQSVFASFQVDVIESDSKRANILVSNITVATEKEIASGALQTQLDFVNSGSPYSIEEGFIPIDPGDAPTSSPTNTTNSEATQPFEEKGSSSSSTTIVLIVMGVIIGICFIAIFCHVGRGPKSRQLEKFDKDDMNIVSARPDTLDADHGYFEEEYRYGTIDHIEAGSHGSKPEHGMFPQVFCGAKMVSQTISQSSTSASTADDAEQAPILGVSPIQSTAVDNSKTNRSENKTMRMPIWEGEGENDSAGGSSSSSGSDSGSESGSGSDTESDSESGSDSDSDDESLSDSSESQ